MMNNQQSYMGGYNPYMYANQQQQKQVAFTNPAFEETKVLRQNVPEFSLNVDQNDVIRAKCTHRNPMNNSTTIQKNPSGSFTCSLCGTTFNMVDTSKEKVTEVVDSVVDVLETSKIMFVDMPDEAISTYYAMIPYLKKLPELYTLSADTFSKTVGANPADMQQQSYMGMGDPFAVMNNGLTQPLYAPQPGAGYGAPMYGGYMQQPQQNVYDNAPAQYGNPMQAGYVPPAQAGFAPMNPVAPQGQPAQQPAAPVTEGEVKTTKQMEI